MTELYIVTRPLRSLCSVCRVGLCPELWGLAEFCSVGRRGIEKIGGLTAGVNPGCLG